MLLKIIQIYIPEFIKNRKLNQLFRLTANAFQCELPELRGHSFADRLLEYALFTKEQAERYLIGGEPLEEVKRRLYQNSYVYGQDLRNRLHIETWKEAVTALKIIYKLIGIDFQYDSQSEFVISQCFFSKHYSAGVCELISSLDEGMAAGLSGGGRLCFKQRLTEGGSCCIGCFNEVN